MSFLYESVLPGTAALHGRPVANTEQKRRLRKSQSYGGLFSPLVELARDPKNALGSIYESWNNESLWGMSPESDDSGRTGRKDVLQLRMKNAETYDEWKACATELDCLEGNDTWKNETECAEYDVVLVQARLKQLEDARISCDAPRMLFLIRTALTRSLGGMGDLRLYKHSHIGTKVLIERYIEAARETLHSLVELSARSDCGIDQRQILEQLINARQAFGRSALLLSGGGTFGMNHSGVLKTLWEARLLPRIISGSSAGSIVSSVLCVKTDVEIPEVLEEFCYGDLGVFEKEGEEESVLRKAARFLKYGALFDVGHLVRVMRNLLGDLTFQEAYNRTRRILNICVSSASLYELPRLLNYVTAPNVIIWSAVAASCSVPLVFSAAQLLAKDPRTGEEVPWNPSPQRWIDGSVDNDLPMTRLAEMFNVNHFIVSQVNPHVVPFLMKENNIQPGDKLPASNQSDSPGWLDTIAGLAKSEALHRMHILSELGIFANYFTKVRSVLSQRYSGDITILPDIPYAHFPRILKNPTTDFILQAMLSGERATWPKLSHIQNHCAIELALDDAVQEVRTRIVFSPSQVDLRLSSFQRIGSSDNTRPREHLRRTTRHSRRPYSTIEPGINKSPLHTRRTHFNLSRPTSSLSSPPPRLLPSVSDFPQQISIPSRYPSNRAAPSPAEAFSTSNTSDPDNGDLDTSEDDARAAAGYSSEESPPSSPMPSLWPSTRPLFPHASQPATPFLGGGSFSAASSSSNLVMTSAGAPSAPEARYKRLFHPNSKKDSGERSVTDLPSEPRQSNAPTQQPLVLDLSGTKGMMLRRKKSVREGLKAGVQRLGLSRPS